MHDKQIAVQAHRNFGNCLQGLLATYSQDPKIGYLLEMQKAIQEKDQDLQGQPLGSEAIMALVEDIAVVDTNSAHKAIIEQTVRSYLNIRHYNSISGKESDHAVMILVGEMINRSAGDISTWRDIIWKFVSVPVWFQEGLNFGVFTIVNAIAVVGQIANDTMPNLLRFRDSVALRLLFVKRLVRTWCIEFLNKKQRS